MRAFYEEAVAAMNTDTDTDASSIPPNRQQYYIKTDSINIPDDLKSWISIEAHTTSELLEKALAYYGFRQNNTIRFELWSNTKYNKGIRLDTLEIIPKEYEFIWLRATPAY